MDSFAPQPSVHENVKELRAYLGARNHRGERLALLPRDELAALVGERHPTRKPNGSTVQRWEEDGEPDIDSIAILADLAGISFEAFAAPSVRRAGKSSTRGAVVVVVKPPTGARAKQQARGK